MNGGNIMKVGLVLSGGGGKGAYELGVWKALVEMKLDKYIEVISGTSIGAFNLCPICSRGYGQCSSLMG